MVPKLVPVIYGFNAFRTREEDILSTMDTTADCVLSPNYPLFRSFTVIIIGNTGNRKWMD